MALFLRGPASAYETEGSQSSGTSTSYANRVAAVMAQKTWTVMPQPGASSKCPDGWVMSEFGCMMPTRPDAACPPGSQQTGYGCLPTNTTPPPTNTPLNIVASSLTPPTPPPPPQASPPIVPPTPVIPPSPSDPSQQATMPGTIITTTPAPMASMVLYKFGMSPKLWLGVLGVLGAGGIYALWRRRKRG